MKIMKPNHTLKLSVSLGLAASLSALRTFQKANCSKHISVMDTMHFLFAVWPELHTGRILFIIWSGVYWSHHSIPCCVGSWDVVRLRSVYYCAIPFFLNEQCIYWALPCEGSLRLVLSHATLCDKHHKKMHRCISSI